MEGHAVADDQSHYEISLTAGQAFVAFVLLLLSLAAAFAFGLMLGKGQADERLVVRKETPVVTEASAMGGKAKPSGDIVELGVAADDFVEDAPAATETMSTAIESTATVVEEASVEPAASAGVTPPVAAITTTAEAAVSTQKVPHIAQLLSTGDQKTAEALAVKVINGGFNTAYVERGATDKGAIYRVRVRFDSEPEARAAETKLREFSKDVWITAK